MPSFLSVCIYLMAGPIRDNILQVFTWGTAAAFGMTPRLEGYDKVDFLFDTYVSIVFGTIKLLDERIRAGVLFLSGIVLKQNV